MLDFADNHVIRIPCMADPLRQMFDRYYGAPSDFCTGGRLAKKLQLLPIQSVSWHDHRGKIIESVAREAEWLTGRPIPAPTDSLCSPSPKDDPVVQARLAGLNEED